MWTRSVGLGVAAAVLLTLASGCKQSSSDNEAARRDPQPQTPKTEPFESVARIHWLGTEKMALDTNASHFLGLWNLPEGSRLENQTLDKLADALVGSLSPTNIQAAAGAAPSSPLAFPKPTNSAPRISLSPSAALIRPLLSDVIKRECYFEIGASTNEPGEVLLALHVDEAEARSWQTNLTAALDSLVGSHTDRTNSERIWTLSVTNRGSGAPSGAIPLQGFRSIHLHRAGEWTVLGLTSEQQIVLDYLLNRIRSEGPYFAAGQTNTWIETRFDLSGIKRVLSYAWDLPANFPKVKATLTGEGDNVRTRGELEFPQGISIQLSPWIVPTNLVHDPVIGFSAARGVSSLLSSLPVWKQLNLTTAPNQVFAWSQIGMPVLEYVAAPWPDASNVVRQASEPLLKIANSWLMTKSMGHLSASAGSNTVTWESAPFITPKLTSVADDQGDFVFAGLVPIVRTNSPLPQALLNEFVTDKNRIYYSWEMTAPKLEQVQYISQLVRLICKVPQLPPDSASARWLVAAGPQMRDCVTVASLDSSNRLSFTRKSSFGLDSVELQVLADWLESPTFPRGFYTTSAPVAANPMAAPH